MFTWRGRGVAWRMAGSCLVVLVFWTAALCGADRAGADDRSPDEATTIPVPDGFTPHALDADDRTFATTRLGPAAMPLARFDSMPPEQVELMAIDQRNVFGLPMSRDDYAAARRELQRRIGLLVDPTMVRSGFGYPAYYVNVLRTSVLERVVWVGIGTTFAGRREIFGGALIQVDGGFLWLTVRSMAVSDEVRAVTLTRLLDWADLMQGRERSPTRPGAGSPVAITGRRPRDPTVEDPPGSPTSHPPYHHSPHGGGGHGFGKALGGALIGFFGWLWRSIKRLFRGPDERRK